MSSLSFPFYCDLVFSHVVNLCRFLLLFSSGRAEPSLAAELKIIRKAIDRQERNSSGYVEDRVRDSAANMFGVSTMRTFLAKCLYDLVVLSNPQEYSHEDIVAGETQLEQFARDHFIAFVQAFHEHLCLKVDDPSQILADNPWVVSGEIVLENIQSSGGVLNNSQNAIKKRILYGLESTEVDMSPFRRSVGPGLCIVVWKATCVPDGPGEFLAEIEVDCRGKVDLLLTTHRAVVMGAEIKTSAADIPRAKKQLIRRFKIISTCLAVTHKIKAEESIFIGRVFYRNVPENSIIDSSEDASGNGLATLSFYYHRV
jgi:hypothetical protein